MSEVKRFILAKRVEEMYAKKKTEQPNLSVEQAASELIIELGETFGPASVANWLLQRKKWRQSLEDTENKELFEFDTNV
jgi:hypothetical protein